MNDLIAPSMQRLQMEVAALPQYEPLTKHYFHGGMYCREVWREAGIIVIGKVHRKEHFYLIASGTVVVNPGDGAQEITGPHLMKSMPGTKRAVLSLTDVLCMTFHRTDATTIEDAERELVEDEPTAMFDVGNTLKMEVLQ